MGTFAWFKPWGWVYRPTSWQGAIVVALAVAFCAPVFVAVDRRSHSASDTLYGMFPYVVPCLMLLNRVASKTSRPRHSTPSRLAPNEAHELAGGTVTGDRALAAARIAAGVRARHRGDRSLFTLGGHLLRLQPRHLA